MVDNGAEAPALSKSAAKKLAAKQAKEAKKAETQARFVKQRFEDKFCFSKEFLKTVNV